MTPFASGGVSPPVGAAVAVVRLSFATVASTRTSCANFGRFAVPDVDRVPLRRSRCGNRWAPHHEQVAECHAVRAVDRDRISPARPWQSTRKPSITQYETLKLLDRTELAAIP